MDTPLAESGILGTAVGLAYRGYRPVFEIQFDGFIYPAFDQIVSQVARMHYRTRRRRAACRSPSGCRSPAASARPSTTPTRPRRTSRTPPGCAWSARPNPQDAYTLIQQAIACDDPVLYFEPKRRYHVKGEVDETAALADARPMGTARVVVAGTDVTLVTYGGLVQTALDAAIAAADEGVSVEVIDLRSLSPIDMDTVIASVRKTGRLVVTHEAPLSGGLGAEVAAGITERCFYYLEHAPVRVTGHDIPYPAAKLEGAHLPDLDRILDGVDRALDRPNSLTGVED